MIDVTSIDGSFSRDGMMASRQKTASHLEWPHIIGLKVFDEKSVKNRNLKMVSWRHIKMLNFYMIWDFKSGSVAEIN